MKITKTIRFTGYVRLIPEEVKKSIKVIHMLRHPEGLLQSLHLDERAQNVRTGFTAMYHYHVLTATFRALHVSR